MQFQTLRPKTPFNMFFIIAIISPQTLRPKTLPPLNVYHRHHRKTKNQKISKIGKNRIQTLRPKPLFLLNLYHRHHKPPMPDTFRFFRRKAEFSKRIQVLNEFVEAETRQRRQSKASAHTNSFRTCEF